MKEIVHVPQCRNGKIALLHITLSGGLITVLKQDKNEIFRAAHDASRAADFLLALERDRSLSSEAPEIAHPYQRGLDRTFDREALERPLHLKGGRQASAFAAVTTPERPMVRRNRTTGRER